MNTTNTHELLKKVRKIEIKTKSLSHQIFAGEYHSAFKGKGMAFSEVREYQYGDDVRNMDWNVTARYQKPYVKVFEEERELTVMLLIDISSSALFGTSLKTKRELIAEIAAVLCFSASINNDKVGAIFFSNKIEQFIPPKKGRSHLLRIIRQMLELKPQSGGTNISEALRFLTNSMKRRCTAFLLSDLIDVDNTLGINYEEALKVAINRHELSVIKVLDPREKTLPDIGMVNVKDAETGQSEWIDTSSKMVRRQYEQWYKSLEDNTNTMLNKYNVDKVDIHTNSDYVAALMKLFRGR